MAVVLSAAGVALGIPLADPLIGLAITAAILMVLRDAATQVLRRLLDTVDPDTVEAVERAAATVDGVDRAYEVRIRWIGHCLRAELAVTVDAALTVEAAHRIAHDMEHRLIHDVPRLTAAVVHTEPASRAWAAHRSRPPQPDGGTSDITRPEPSRTCTRCRPTCDRYQRGSIPKGVGPSMWGD